jgi:hypothetical protein
MNQSKYPAFSKNPWLVKFPAERENKEAWSYWS